MEFIFEGLTYPVAINAKFQDEQTNLVEKISFFQNFKAIRTLLHFAKNIFCF